MLAMGLRPMNRPARRVCGDGLLGLEQSQRLPPFSEALRLPSGPRTARRHPRGPRSWKTAVSGNSSAATRRCRHTGPTGRSTDEFRFPTTSDELRILGACARPNSSPRRKANTLRCLVREPREGRSQRHTSAGARSNLGFSNATADGFARGRLRLSVIYRSIFRFKSLDPLSDATRLMNDWLRSKNLPREISVGDETSEAVSEPYSIRRLDSDMVQIDARRIRFTQEDTPGERWSTELTVWRDPGSESFGWAWIDLSRVAEDPFARRAPVSVPALTGRFMRSMECSVGSTRLTSDVRIVDSSLSASELVGEIFDEARRIPIIVVTALHNEPLNSAIGRAKEVQRLTSGLAVTVVLGPAGQIPFESNVGLVLHVFGGGVRTYLPQARPGAGWRHRYFPGFRVQEFDRTKWELALRPFIQQATGARPPADVRELLTRAFRPDAADRSADELLEDLLASEERETLLQEQLRDLFDERDEMTRQLDHATRRVRWLESQTGADIEQPVDDSEETSSPLTCMEALERAVAELQHVEIGVAAIDHADVLDATANRAVWADIVWRSLRSLDEFAAAKADPLSPFKGDFERWCKDGRAHGSIDYSPTESPDTRKNAKFRRARRFPVPPVIDESGFVEMFSHVRVGSGKPPAPRMHVYDGTAVTGKIYVGYLGPHLPNKSTN